MPGGRRWRPGSEHRDTSGSGAAEKQVGQSLSRLLQLGQCHHSTTIPSYHARGLHGFREAGSIRLTPEHVAAEGGWAGSHDECKRVDISAHCQEGEEAYPTLPQHCLCLEGGNPVSKLPESQYLPGTSTLLAVLPLPPSLLTTAKHCHTSPAPGLYLLVQDGEGGRGHADMTWGPLLTATGGQD